MIKDWIIDSKESLLAQYFSLKKLIFLESEKFIKSYFIPDI